MSKGTVHDCDRAAPEVTASSGLEDAAAGLGTEIVRFSRLIAAWKQRVKGDGGAADRVLLARLVVGGDQRATDLAADAFLDLSTVSSTGALAGGAGPGDPSPGPGGPPRVAAGRD